MIEPAAPEYDEADQRRRHGLWGLGVLAMIAVVVIAFILLFTGGKHGADNGSGGQDDSTLSGALPGQSGTSHAGGGRSATSTSHVRPSTSASSLPAGLSGIAAGINELRIRNGLSPVPASGSADAQGCAVSRGEGSSCVPHYMYAHVGSSDASAAVAALQNVNSSWLLDPTIERIEIGLVPDPGGGYDCAVLKFTP